MFRCFLPILVSVLILTTPVFSEAKQEFHVGLGDPLEGEMGAFSLRFKQIVEERSHGEIEIILHPNSELGDESVMLQNVAIGVLDMTVVGIGNTVPFVPELGIVTLPYLFENMDLVVKGTTGQAQEILNSYAVPKGNFRILGWVYNDYRHISNSKKPITKLKDIKDMTFRVPLNTVFIDTYESWGAVPKAISWSQTYEALDSGEVDGQCIGFISFKAVNFHEAKQKYITKVHYTYHIQPLIIGESLYKELNENERNIIVTAAKDAQLFSLVYQYEQSAKAQEELQALGIQIDVLEDEEKWMKAARQQVWPNMINFLGGKEKVNNYLKAIDVSTIK